MRRLALVVLTLAVSGCKCGGGTLSSRFGELVVVQLGATGREVISRDATLTLPSAFMETLGAGEVPVRNVGLEEISILSVTRLEGDASLSLDDAVGLVIGADQDAVLPVRFSPLQATDATLRDLTHRAKFSLALSGAREGEAEVLIELIALAVARDCFVPSVIDFGQVPLQQAVVSPLVLENGRALAASTTWSAVTGADASAFFFETTSPLEVPANGRVEVPVRFSPLEERAYEATITVQRGAACPAAQVRLIGEGSNQALSWTPARLDFGRLPLGVSLTKTVTVVNNANVALSLISAVGTADFVIEPGAPTSLAPRSSTTLQVTCAPRVLGPLSALLALDVGTVPLTPARVPLSCVGGGPRIRVDPNPIQFGQVPLNSTGTAVTRRRLLVQNVGTAPPAPGDATNNLVLGRAGTLPWFAIVPKNPLTRVDEFTVALRGSYDNAIGLPAVAGRNFAEFEVSIAPSSAGVREADLLVYSNDQTEPAARIALTAVPRLPERCSLTVSPEGADFGASPRGAVLNRIISLTNAPDAQGASCLVSGIEMAPGSDLAFLVSDPLASSILIPRGQTRGVRVQAAVPGDANVGDYLRGALRFSVSGEAAPRSIPVDLKVSRCLVVDPPLIDVGLVQQNCTSGAKTITLYNVCGVPITITGHSTPSLPFRVTSSPLGAGPVVLDSADQLRIQIAAAPATVGNFSDVLRIDTEEAGVPYSEGVALRVVADPDGIQQETFTQGNAEVDILLVIDDSCSMGEEQAALATNFAAFMSSAATSNGNWHIGVTTTDIFTKKGVLERTSTNPATLTPTTPNVASLFAQKVQVGTTGAGYEQALAAMSLAITNPNRTGANAGFLRTDAALAVVIVTDAVEQSPNSVGSYLATLRAAKGNRSELVSVSVVGPFTPPSATCFTEGTVDPSRFQAAITSTGGVRSDICTQDWATDLQTISRSVFGARRVFELTSTARGTDMAVTVDGVLLPGSGWRFDSISNAVVLDTAPPPGAVIGVSYRTACF
ncbi:MAG: choice-of-anchor D domain-containing protein [Archangium sp.]|nr:choice-of-anchor D domain-containing protein [Archangium sp.]MDP3572259.1 choice-of-anchor D domain-containing protein [Archangium sp.]